MEEIDFKKLPNMEQFEWEDKINKLFYDSRTKVRINLFNLKTTTYIELKTGKETTFSGFMEGAKDFPLEEMEKLPVLASPRTFFNRPTDEDFEKLFQAKLESCQGGKEEFIDNEKKEIAKIPDYITKEFTTIRAWEKFLNDKVKKVNLGGDEKSVINSKFKSEYSDKCLTDIMHLLIKMKKGLDKETDAGLWLYWFNRNPKYEKVEPFKWKGSPTMISNIIQTICKTAEADVIKEAFGVEKVKPSASEYAKIKIIKSIKQLITIDKKK
jgi:hypothetical protein